MENYKLRKYIIMLMIDVLVVDDDVGALLSYVQFAEILQTQFSRTHKY